MKATRHREATQARENLSLDFNPRDLVTTCAPSKLSSTRGEQKELDAIYIPTKGRPEQVSRLLSNLRASRVPVYLLPSAPNDIPTGRPPEGLHLEELSFLDAVFLEAFRSLRCFSNPLFTVPTDVWDLPFKRNYALWHAHKLGFNRILLLDDDILGMDDTRCLAGADALSQWSLAGFFVDDFPDTSVVGHVKLSLGEPVSPFLSGSCLFLRTDLTTGFFPPIYNEDWIFMAQEIARGSVCSLGLIQQEAHDPFARPGTAMFQEPGEIIADGLFALLVAGRYADRFSLNVWAALLSQRRCWLTVLADRTKHPRHLSAIDEARTICTKLTSEDCVGFISVYEQDIPNWNQTLREVG